MDEITQRSIEEAKRRILARYPGPTIIDIVKAKGQAISEHVADAVKKEYKDHSPHKDDFLRFVGGKYEEQFRAWAKENWEEFLVYSVCIHAKIAYDRLID
jgi:hypothetical protein